MFCFGKKSSMAFKRKVGVPHRQAKVFTRTIDSLRESQSYMKPYRPIVFDELKPADHDQNQYYSEDYSCFQYFRMPVLL